MMHLLYLDDSGSAPNRNEKHFVLAGLSIFERQIYFIANQLDQLAASIWPEAPDRVEFHASEIFSGRIMPWKEMTNKNDRIEVIKKVLRIAAQAHESVRLFACVVQKDAFPGQDPVEIAFENLCNRFDLLLKRLYVTQNDQQRGLIILDKTTSETSLQRLATEFRSVGTRWGVMRNLSEVPLFVDSKATRLVQLADHVAYSVFRRYESGDTSYLDLILPKFDAENGKIHGLVHLPTNVSNCFCPACMSRS
jgi:hypothetical protein